ncbi:M15 family metallopeptidase [Nitratifractor sp.]|uniref:M15 family metallopeptidase n=1 Tax=Nitratifractor sp. TaxID=2268144 RepID=UPI0025CF4E0F|nr:M15 family metallopeptidase [Nitratifractor sp.]
MKWTHYIVSVLMTGSMALQASCLDLVRAYPDSLKNCSGNTLIWRDGTKMRYDDGKRNKSFDELLNRPDLEDMFHYRYPKGAAGYGKAPRKNFDPGRIRYEPFFRKMYGDSAGEVKRHLTTIPWIPRSTEGKYRIRITRVNGVDRQLRKVSQDLDKLLQKHPGYRKYLVPVGGTFKWRTIAGTHRLSVHSFGAAIDINVKHSAYWRWNKGPYRYRNEIPLPIVKIFEKHGFIWGGKWYHYDTMHFEYRPELLGTRTVQKGSQAPEKRGAVKGGNLY